MTARKPKAKVESEAAASNEHASVADRTHIETDGGEGILFEPLGYVSPDVAAAMAGEQVIINTDLVDVSATPEDEEDA